MPLCVIFVGDTVVSHTSACTADPCTSARSPASHCDVPLEGKAVHSKTMFPSASDAYIHSSPAVSSLLSQCDYMILPKRE